MPSLIGARDRPTVLRRALLLLWLLWAAVLLLVYYRQIWRLYVLGPAAWLADNPSLASANAFRHVLVAGPSAWGLPAWREALGRGLSAVWGAGLVLLAAQVLGAVVFWLLRWRLEDWREGVLYRTGIGLGVLSYLSFGLAALGIYRPNSVRILLTVVLSFGTLWLSWTVSHGGKERLTGLIGRARAVRPRARDLAWQIIALVAVTVTLIGALAPEIEYDALWYHLWLPKLWLRQGRPVDIVAEYISLYPLSWELGYGCAMVLGGPVAAKLLHWACLVLVALLAYQLTQRFMPLASPWLAVALAVTVPTAIWEGTTAYVDLAAAFYTGLAVYALLRYLGKRQRQWLVLAALSLGLDLATKHLALLVLALSVIGLALRLWLEDRDWRRALGPAVFLGGVSLLLPMAWYLRNWLASGNPVFPDLYHVFGAFPAERWSDLTERGLAHFKDHFGDPRTLPNMLLLPWNMTVHAARYGGSLGPMFLLLLPALALVRRKRETAWLLAFVLAYIALWASPLSSFQMRFLMLMVPFLSVLAAEAYGRLGELVNGWRGLGTILWAGTTGLLLLNLPPFTSLHERDRPEANGWLTHVTTQIPLGVVIGHESEQHYLSRRVPSYAAWLYINEQLPADARILTFSGGDQLYSNRERLPSDSTVARLATWGSVRGQEQQALQTMHWLGISHVLFDKAMLTNGQLDNLALAQSTAMSEWYELQYQDIRFVLYRLRWEDLGAQIQDDTVRYVDESLMVERGMGAPGAMADLAQPGQISRWTWSLAAACVVLVNGVILLGPWRARSTQNRVIRRSSTKRRLAHVYDVLRELVLRELKLRYRRSVLGILWSLLSPLAQLLVFVLIFDRVLRLNIPNYASFVFVGVLSWNWFQSALSVATGAITDNRELVKRPGFPMAILPVVTVTTHLIHFVLALPILLLFILLSGGRLTGAVLLLPLVMALQFLLILGLGYLTAAVHVTFRDTQHLLAVFLMLLFYLTPVFYDSKIIPQRFRTVYDLNPMTRLIAAYRAILIQGQLPDLTGLLVLGGVLGLLVWLGYTIFRRASYRFVEEL